MSYLLAVSPILLFVTLLLVARIRIQFVAPLAFGYTAILAVWQWALPLHHLSSALGKGFFLTLDILLIIFGAITFLNFLKKVGVLKEFETLLASISSDRRIQAILLAWFFGSFIEATSGFGTPALVVAPLLVGIGFPSVLAIVICLVANTTAVVFGAVGTPLRVGFAGLDISHVSEKAAFINLFAGLVVPILIVAFVVRSGPRLQRFKAFFECIPWAIFSGLAFLIPYYAVSRFGFEFPSIAGSAIGMAIAVTSIRMNFLIPKSVFKFETEPPNLPQPLSKKSLSPLGPYLLLVILLMVGKQLFSNFKFSFDLSSELSHTLHLFNPGFAFLTAILVLNVFKRLRFKDLIQLGTSSFGLLGKTAISICSVAAMTYTMALTGANNATGILQTVSEPLANSGLPFFAVFIGAFGSFLAGSATVSNLLFAQIQVQAAQQLGFAVAWILALQLVGAGIGNMIALPNLLAVGAAVGVHDQEANLLRRLVLPCLLYLIIAGTLGLILI
jgi:lactate permease